MTGKLLRKHTRIVVEKELTQYYVEVIKLAYGDKNAMRIINKECDKEYGENSLSFISLKECNKVLRRIELTIRKRFYINIPESKWSDDGEFRDYRVSVTPKNKSRT